MCGHYVERCGQKAQRSLFLFPATILVAVIGVVWLFWNLTAIGQGSTAVNS